MLWKKTHHASAQAQSCRLWIGPFRCSQIMTTHCKLLLLVVHSVMVPRAIGSKNRQTRSVVDEVRVWGEMDGGVEAKHGGGQRQLQRGGCVRCEKKKKEEERRKKKEERKKKERKK